MFRTIVFRPFILSALAILAALFVAACQPPAPPASDSANEDAVAPTAAAEAETEGDAEQTAGEAQADAGSAKTFAIVEEGTQARFFIDEILLGADKRVEGVTSLVTGEIVVDPADPPTAQIGVIQIDARDFTTDSGRRNGAIRRFVLQSEQDANRYITFTPTSIEGLPESVSVGEPFTFIVVGDLQIRDTVRPETFEITATLNSDDEITGLGSTTIMRADYDLTIPSVPSVAGVDEDVLLEIEFRAVSGG